MAAAHHQSSGLHRALKPIHTHKPFTHSSKNAYRASSRRPFTSSRPSRGITLRAAESFEAPQEGESDAPVEREYKPFPRLNERDPYRRLGLGRDASFEEIIDAKNYLYEQYKWHAASKESIELAFDSLIQDKLKARNKFGFRPPRTGRRSDVIGEADRKTPLQQFLGLFDPAATVQSVLNEGIVYAGLALWAFLTQDVSLPLASTFIYSIYRFQQKRKLINPDGPFIGGNALFGAIFAGGVSLGLGAATGMAVVKAMTMGGALSPTLILITQAVATILTAGLLSICLR